jgi:hypothetical protein
VNAYAQLKRIGENATVYTRTPAGEDQFGNTEYEWTADHVIAAVRSYPNRNTDQERNSGTMAGDRPVFILPVPTGSVQADQPSPPTTDDRLEYNGIMYALESQTRYDQHVEMMGNRIDN